MKQYFFIALIVGAGMSSCSGGIAASKVPSVVRNTFTARHAEATDVDWEKKKGFYEAEVDKGTTDLTLQIDESGKLLREKEELAVNQLPAPLAAAVAARYTGYAVEEVERITEGGSSYYQLELDAKGKEEVKLSVSADGTELKDKAYWN